MTERYPLLLRNVIYPLSQELRGRHYKEISSRAAAQQFLDPQELKDLQFRKLKALLAHAYRSVPFYRDSFSSAGFKPGDLQTWEDFKRLPTLSREHIRDHPTAFLSSAPRSKVKLLRTSGSTGTPLSFYVSEMALGCSNISRIRALRWWGIDLGEREFRFWGHDLMLKPGLKNEVHMFFVCTLKDRIMNRRILRCSVIDMSEASMPDYWKEIQRFHPKYLMGAVSVVYLFAKFLQKQGLDGHSLNLKAVVTTAEVLYEWQRECIESVFGCTVADEYGAVETGVIAYGAPCGRMHTMDDFLIVEVLKTHPDNQHGEVVVTHLENWDSPLIRYNLQDLAIDIDEPCDCPLGLGLSRIQKVIGRTTDLFRLPDGRLVYGLVFARIVQQSNSFLQYQIVQRQPDQFDIYAVLDQERFSIEEEERIRRRLRENFGPIQVTIHPLELLPDEGASKFRWVRSEIEP